MLVLGTIHKVCAIKFDTFGSPSGFGPWEIIILIKLYKTDRRIFMIEMFLHH